MNFFFWNIGGQDDKNLGSTLDDIVDYEKPDIILLAESKFDETYLAKKGFSHVNTITKTDFNLNLKLQMYSRQNGFLLTPYLDNNDGEIMACHLDVGKKNYLLFGVHFMSKTNIKSPDDQYKRAMEYRKFINGTEDDFKKMPSGTTRQVEGSILFGDLNINPFEKPLVDNEALFAIDLKRRPAKKLVRMRYFINPTFSIFGHFGRKKNGDQAAPGTYYLNKDHRRSDEFFWNCLDGMLFRPELVDLYEQGEPLEIITEIKDATGTIKHSFFDFSTMKINKSRYSDHLPIKFTFKI